MFIEAGVFYLFFFGVLPQKYNLISVLLENVFNVKFVTMKRCLQRAYVRLRA